MITIAHARGKWVVFNEYNWDIYGEFTKLEDAVDRYTEETWRQKDTQPFGWYLWFSRIWREQNVWNSWISCFNPRKNISNDIKCS